MGQFWHIENGALRLASFGLGVMIAWLLWLRVNDLRTGRVLVGAERPVQSLAPLMVGVVAMLFAALIFVTTATAIVGRFPTWLSDPEPVSTYVMYVPINVIAVILIDRLAYHPSAKWCWCAGWVLLAQIVQWGGFLLAAR